MNLIKKGVGMLTAFTCQDGTLRRIAEPLSGAQWIDLLQPTSDEIERVTRETDFTIPTEADIHEIESSSRLATRDGALYLSLPLVASPETDPRPVTVGFVLSPNRLITVRFAVSQLADRFMEQDHIGMHSAAHIMVVLLEAIVDRLADALEHVKTELELISH